MSQAELVGLEVYPRIERPLTEASRAAMNWIVGQLVSVPGADECFTPRFIGSDGRVGAAKAVTLVSATEFKRWYEDLNKPKASIHKIPDSLVVEAVRNGVNRNPDSKRRIWANVGSLSPLGRGNELSVMLNSTELGNGVSLGRDKSHISLMFDKLGGSISLSERTHLTLGTLTEYNRAIYERLTELLPSVVRLELEPTDTKSVSSSLIDSKYRRVPATS